MTPQAKSKAKLFFGGIHQIMTIIGFAILIGISLRTYNQVVSDHDLIIKLAPIVSQHEKRLGKLDKKVSWRAGQMNYVLNKLQIKPSEIPNYEELDTDDTN